MYAGPALSCRKLQGNIICNTCGIEVRASGLLSPHPQLVGQPYMLLIESATSSSMAACAMAAGDVVAWLACLPLSLHQSPQDGVSGGRTSSNDAVIQASTLLHHGKLKRGMWQHMRGLRDLGMAHTFHTAVPHTSSAWPHPNVLLNKARQSSKM